MKHSLAGRGLSFLVTLAILIAMLPATLAADSNPTLESVAVAPGTAALKVGEHQTLNATITMSDGSTTLPAGSNVKWEEVDGRYDEVKITPTGVYSLSADVEALAIPETTEKRSVQIKVTVTPPAGYGVANSAICEITISPNEPSGVVVTPATVELAPGGSKALIATVNPATADQEVTWRSDNTGIATVSPTGTSSASVTGVAAGETKVYARIKDGTQEAASTIYVQGIILENTAVTINERDKYTLKYTIYGPSIKDKGVTWTSSDSSIVRVDAGYLYGIKEGKATITAKVNGTNYTAQCEVTVKRNTATVITASAAAGEPLSFSGLVSELQNRCSTVLGSSLVYVSSLSVPTEQGTLYYRYASEGDTGAGVATSSSYYVSPGAAQMGLSEITFVPKADFSGTAVISYIGYASGTSFFQGTIEVSVAAQQDVTYTTTNGAAVQMDPTDFAVVCRARTGRDLSHVTFTLPDSSVGMLRYNYLSAKNPGTEVRSSIEYKYSGTPGLGQVFFVPASGYKGRVVITYTAWDTNRQSFQGRLVIQVNEDSKSDELSYTVAPGKAVSFDVNDFNDLSREVTGYSLDYVRFTLPASSEGILYYNYSNSSSEKVSAGKNYYRSSSPYLDRVDFVAASDFTGTVSIPFTGWSTSGATFSGTVTVRVKTGTDSISYRTEYGQAVDFQAGDFNDISQNKTGSTLNYVRFTLPSSAQGTLYYNYTGSTTSEKVVSSRNYYRSSYPYVDQISFVPTYGYTGTCTIDYTGWGTNGEKFTGTVTIQVGNETETIRYTTDENVAVGFRASDFNAVCQDATNSTLNYVRFTLPPSARGTLYYNGSKVSATQNYAYSSSPYLDQVSFTPASGYNGTVTINYTGWATSGDRFTGTVTIRVGTQGSEIGYTTKSRQAVDFQVEDFNEASLSLTGSSLNYVRFTLPSSSQGTLYYNYVNSSSEKVSANKNYYRSSSPYLDEITFVPASGFTDNCSIPYTAWGSNGDRFTGTVTIRVDSAATTIYYDTGLGEPVTFRPSDFNNAAQAAQNRDLSYVRFTLPSSSQGTLYYKYENGEYTNKVSANTSYYRTSSPYLDEVSFVPAAGFTGTATVSYSGYTVGGTSFTGTVEITVSSDTNDTADTIRYTSSYAPVTFRASDFTAACNGRNKGSLSSVQFDTSTLSSNAGRLYTQYGGLQSANTEVRSGTKYYPESSPSLSQVTFVPRIGFQGTAVVAYTGVDSQGRSYRGQVEITVTPSASSRYFKDMSTGYSWAVPAVDLLYENGVVGGVGNSSFAPASPLTRGSFITMLDRALGFPHGSQKSFPDVPDGQYYTESVRSAYALGIVNGFSDGTFRPDAPITRAEAVTMLYRAMQTMGWVIGTEDPSILNAYTDGAYVADYARGAMSVMVQTGVVQGSGGLLEPGRIMTRAEMAVALARALTL